MTKNTPSASKGSITTKETETLVASYGRAITPAKKASLMAQLGAERTKYEKANNPATQTRTKPGLER